MSQEHLVDYKDVSHSNKGKRCPKSVVKIASATNKGKNNVEKKES